MVVEKGFKQTEVGIIPTDWDTSAIFELADRKKELFDDGDWIEAEHITDRGIRLIQTGNIGIGRFVEKDVKKYIFQKSYEVLRCKNLNIGDLLICRLAEPAGRSCIFPNLKDGVVITSVDVTIFRPNETIVNRNYLNQYFTTNTWFNAVSENCGGTTHKRISRGALGKLKLPLPPLPEQTAIANALSDMDALIAQTEKLIEKKKAIKQGVMQELLKPKEGWVTKKLGEVFTAMKGKILGKSDLNPNGKYDCILYGELFTTYKEEISVIKSRTNQTGVASVCDDILFPGSTTTSGIDLAKSSVVLKDNVQLGGDILILRKQTKEISSLFVSFYLNQFCKNEIAQSTRGITIHHLYGKDLVGIKIKYPKLNEQACIVNSILDIEHEVEILLKKLQKLKHQKQGMMQALLTGKIRLI